MMILIRGIGMDANDWQAVSSVAQTLLLAAGLGWGVFQLKRAEATGREAEAQAAYREYLSLGIENPLCACGAPATASPEEVARYERFVTYALAACEKICDTALAPNVPYWPRSETDRREWERSVDEVLSIHADFVGDAQRLKERELETYSASLQTRIRAKFPNRRLQKAVAS
jgi:hypothetical protein